MIRVIAVQEGQLNTLRDNYAKLAPAKDAPQSNADLLSGSLNNVAPVSNNTPSMPSAPQIDMEGQVVNMNPVETQSNVVNNDITSQVFGVAPVVAESVSAPSPENIFATTGAPSEVVATNNNMTTNTPVMDVPYQEPVITQNVPSTNVMSDEAYVKYINFLRDKLTNFYNDMNMEFDKIQEQVLQKSGVNLVGDEKTALAVEPSSNTNGSAQNGFAVNMASTNIFDTQSQTTQQSNFDETMVIPRDVMNEAIAGTPMDFTKAA